MVKTIQRIRHEGLMAWLWSLLPDRCEANKFTYWRCPHKGMRGNENQVLWDHPRGYIIMCDDCSSYWGNELNKKLRSGEAKHHVPPRPLPPRRRAEV